MRPEAGRLLARTIKNRAEAEARRTRAQDFARDLAWHKALPERMTLNIEGIRPALLDLPMSFRVEELLKFRHVFRSIYKSPLVPEKVNLANKAAHNLAEDFRAYHKRFMEFLAGLVRELDGETPG